jgi:tetratricopeptide (TPR) repeat protein
VLRVNAPRVGTQIVQRKKLASANTPHFIAEAEAMIERKQFADARLRLEEGIAAPGQRVVEALLALAEAYWDDPDTAARDPKKSIDFLKEAIQLAPKDARPFALLGRYLLSKGLRDQALNFLDRAIQLDPSDGAIRRLRDRATLQKKKAYTMVANVADFAAMEGKRAAAHESSAAAQHRKEATRLLQIDPKKAAEELAKAERGEQNEVDRALADLLAASLVGADLSILESASAVTSRGGILRTLFAFFFVICVGVVFGAALYYFAPQASSAPKGIEALVLTDTPSALEKASRAEPEEDLPLDNAWKALAHALLYVEHGADEGHVQSAEDQLGTMVGPARRSPPALLARALLSTTNIAEADDEIASDLEAAAGDEKVREHPFTRMALAVDARRAGDGDRSLSLLASAALEDDAPPRALNQLARAYAAEGQHRMAQQLVQRLWQKHPLHTPSMVTAIAADAAERSGGGDDDDDDDGDDKDREKASKVEKDILRRVEQQPLEATDFAPVALMIAAAATARGDDATAGAMQQRAREGEVAAQWPGLLSRLSQLLLLDLGDFARAETMLSDGLRTYPGEIRLLVDRTRARVGRGLKGESIRKLRNDATRALEDGDIVLPLGRFHIEFDEPYLPLRPAFDTRYFPEDAIRTALDLPDLAPAAAERRLEVVANLKLAQLALAQDDLKDAQDRVQLARKEAPSNPEVHLTEALVRSREGDSVRARESIEQALEIAPDDPRILLAAARMQLDTGDVRAARGSLKRIADEGFLSPSSVALEARIAMKEERFDDARDQLAQGRKMAPSDPRLLATAVHVEHEVHALEAGRDIAMKLRKGSPEAARSLADRDVVVRAYLAWAAAEQGSADEAVEQLRELLEVRAGFSEAHYMLGRVLQQQGKGDEAKVSFEEAVRLAGSGPVADLARAALGAGEPVAPESTNKPKKKKRKRKGRRR